MNATPTMLEKAFLIIVIQAVKAKKDHGIGLVGG